MPNLELVPKSDLSSFRRMAIGTWRTVKDPSVYGSIALDASSTVNMLASIIGPRAGLTAYTNSFESFHLRQPHDGVTAVISGGTAEPTTGSLVGPIARRSLRSVYFDIFFSSADALDSTDGTSEVSVDEAELKQAMAANAGTTVVCIDSSKLERRSVARALEREEISVLITELDPGDERLNAFRQTADIL